MRLVTFEYQKQERIGAVDGAGRIVDLQRAYANFLKDSEKHPQADILAAIVLGNDMVEFLKRGAPGLDAAGKALSHVAKSNPGSELSLSQQ
jgi:hypothetical protein